jgi:molecular chaperone DnaK (HSP70)
MLIRQIFEGERHLVRDNLFLASFLLDGIAPALPGDNNINVHFTIDYKNDLIVTASDRFSGVTNGITIPACERRLGTKTTQMVMRVLCARTQSSRVRASEGGQGREQDRE